MDRVVYGSSSKGTLMADILKLISFAQADFSGYKLLHKLCQMCNKKEKCIKEKKRKI